MSRPAPPGDYRRLLADIKVRVRAAQIRAHLAANSELLGLYWDIGRMILGRQQAAGWGAKVIDRLSRDLQNEFPGQQGFSPRNLKYMRAFAAAWPETVVVQPPGAKLSACEAPRSEIVQAPLAQNSQMIAAIVHQPGAQLPWKHHCLLLDMLDSPAERLWYAAQAVENGWSRSVLALQIESALHTRQGRAVTNFKATLPEPQSDLAQQITRDPYLSAVDDRFRQKDDQPSIGRILCRAKNRVIAEYALRDVTKPIGVSDYVTRLVETLPKPLREAIPSVQEIERGLSILKTDLPLEDVVALARVQKRMPLDDKTVRRLKRAGLIEGRKPNLHVSAAIASAADAKAAYIKTRAMDDGYYRKLVAGYLEKFGHGSREDVDDLLRDKISDALDPAQKITKVGNLLSAMRKDGEIENTGPRKTPRWQLTKKNKKE